ncbi:MAG TPA: phosphoribosylanthranilate isomerase [Chthoniobacterales bacterium]|nr:phosphoribosylanthranilate isomerase [Chthoniobacterales bacterium]
MFGGKLKPTGGIFVKICGITNQSDAVGAIEAGADALGFNVVPRSKRCIDLDAAASWIAKLPKNVWKVAVTADPDWEDACRIGQLNFIDALQLHGNESVEFCRRLRGAGIPFAKALPVGQSQSLGAIPDFYTDTIILDSASSAGFGGSGKAFPWKFAWQFAQKHRELNVILAGGLNAENVGEAVKAVRPRGVDVTTGVEEKAGQKDQRLVKAFVEAARAAARP